MKKATLLIALLCPVLATAGELWGTMMVGSKHLNTDRTYNERNFGLGLEYRLSDDWALVAGRYKNSVYGHSTYLGAAYTPLALSPWLRAGIVAGAVNGYEVNDGNFIPLAGGTLTFRVNDHVGFNLIISPTVKDKHPAVIALQLKARF